MTTAAETAKGLSTEEWAALEYIQTNGSYLINDEDEPLTNFDRVFLKGLLNKIYNQDRPRYFLNVYGNAVLETRASAPDAGKPTTITAKEFVEQGYASKIVNRECIVWRNSHRDEQIITIRKSGFDNCPIEVIRPYDTGLYESASIDEATYEVQWLSTPQPATPQAANETAEGRAADVPRPRLGDTLTLKAMADRIKRLETALSAAKEREG